NFERIEYLIYRRACARPQVTLRGNRKSFEEPHPSPPNHQTLQTLRPPEHREMTRRGYSAHESDGVRWFCVVVGPLRQLLAGFESPRMGAGGVALDRALCADLQRHTEPLVTHRAFRLALQPDFASDPDHYPHGLHAERQKTRARYLIVR